MYRLVVFGLITLYVCKLYSAELVVSDPDYYRPPAAQGLRIVTTHDTASTNSQDSCLSPLASPLTSPPLTVPLTAEPTGHSPLFPGTPTTAEELDALVTPLAPSSKQQLRQERLQLSGFSQEQRRSMCTRRYCYMAGGCIGTLVCAAIIVLLERYTHIFK